MGQPVQQSRDREAGRNLGGGGETTFSVISEDIIKQLPPSFLNTKEECAVM